MSAIICFKRFTSVARILLGDCYQIMSKDWFVVLVILQWGIIEHFRGSNFIGR